MTGNDTAAQAVSLLQELGLQEYEVRCFLALTQLPSGTAKEIHEISEVPRMRVYDAIRVLESQGLVEVQHSSPQQYRAIDIDEATRTLRKKYDDRIETLQAEIESVEQRELDSDDDRVQEVWSLSGHQAIESRSLDLIEEAESKIALLVVGENILSDPLYDGLHDAVNRDLSILLGGQTDTIIDQLGTELLSVRVFETDLDWLNASSSKENITVSRILLIDREALLIGTYYPNDDTNKANEQAIFARGLENGIVVLLRRLVSTGLAAVNDPGQ